MNYTNALVQIKAGAAVAREAWNGTGAFVIGMPAQRFRAYNSTGQGPKVNFRVAKWLGADVAIDCEAYLAARMANGRWQPGWNPTQDERQATDWIVFTPVVTNPPTPPQDEVLL